MPVQGMRFSSARRIEMETDFGERRGPAKVFNHGLELHECIFLLVPGPRGADGNRHGAECLARSQRTGVDMGSAPRSASAQLTVSRRAHSE